MKLLKPVKHSVLQDDILRYKKNKFAGNFALLALVFNCFIFYNVICCTCYSDI